VARSLAQEHLPGPVVDDRSTDATPEILHRLAARDPRSPWLASASPGWTGKSHALATAAARATTGGSSSRR
jgi:glycosyltransferase involved in cell wall biosynthesis